MPITLPDPAALTLAISFLLAAYLTDRCWIPPNPDPSGPAASLPTDNTNVDPRAIRGKRYFTSSLWILHVILTLFYPSPPTVLCPNPDNLSSSLFTWSPYTAFVLVAIGIAAPIRLLAFRHLGQNFTFRLAKPKELVKTGLYAYMQHPSYLPHWLIATTNLAFLLRLDGVLGCVLPCGGVRWGLGVVRFGVWPALLVGAAMFGIYAVWVRVMDEETMLKKELGREWEEYHRSTARFIPGLF